MGVWRVGDETRWIVGMALAPRAGDQAILEILSCLGSICGGELKRELRGAVYRRRCRSKTECVTECLGSTEATTW